jgi:hypothetical protein
MCHWLFEINTQARLKNILEFANSAKMVHEAWESIKREHTLFGLVLLGDSDTTAQRSTDGFFFFFLLFLLLFFDCFFCFCDFINDLFSSSSKWWNCLFDVPTQRFYAVPYPRPGTMAVRSLAKGWKESIDFIFVF